MLDIKNVPHYCSRNKKFPVLFYNPKVISVNFKIEHHTRLIVVNRSSKVKIYFDNLSTRIIC